MVSSNASAHDFLASLFKACSQAEQHRREPCSRGDLFTPSLQSGQEGKKTQNQNNGELDLFGFKFFKVFTTQYSNAWHRAQLGECLPSLEL